MAFKSRSGAAQAPTRPASKAGSLEKQFSDLMLSGHFGLWAYRAETTDDAGQAVRWNEHAWEVVGNEAGKAIAAQWLDEAYPTDATPAKAVSSWGYACMRLRLTRQAPAPCRDDVIPTLSGYLKIERSGEIRVSKPDPALGMDYVIKASLPGVKHGAAYTPQLLPADSLFAHYLSVSLPDPDIRAVVQELCAQTLLAANYSVAGWFVGAAGAGKGVLMEIVEAMHQQSCRLRLDRLSDPFGLESLVGSSLVLVDEVGGGKMDEELFKTLVSCNGVDVNRKGIAALRSYKPRAKWLISSNTIPHIKDKSQGVWRRVIFVPWTNSVPAHERIPDLDRSIRESELHHVLDWLLEGAVRIVQRGRFLSDDELPAAITGHKEAMRLESDSIYAWSQEIGVAHVKDGSVWTPKESVYQAYKKWCEAEDRTPLGTETFWKGMQNHFLGFEFRYPRAEGARKRVCNIALGPVHAQLKSPSSDPVQVVHVKPGADPFARLH